MTSKVIVEAHNAQGPGVVVKRSEVVGEGPETTRVFIPNGGAMDFVVYKGMDLSIHELQPGEDWNTWG